jgi:6-pyruvoyltetrahydropterin/6-carboxytetrahydropterin synthase
MYQLGVQGKFNAQHFLIGGDWGSENQLHTHHSRLEIVLEADHLDEHGYLVDLVAVEAQLQASIAGVEGQTLNDLPAFQGLNPSLEHFARILCQDFLTCLRAPSVRIITVRLWENEQAWASYTQELA